MRRVRWLLVALNDDSPQLSHYAVAWGSTGAGCPVGPSRWRDVPIAVISPPVVGAP